MLHKNSREFFGKYIFINLLTIRCFARETSNGLIAKRET